LERCGSFFYSPEGAIWSRIVCTIDLAPIDRLTTAQIIFLGLATAEDARIKSGGGTVDRDQVGAGENMAGMSVADYAKMKRALEPGGEIRTTMERLKREQAPLRKHIEEQAKKVIEREMRNR
jgi:hypothetical protein